MEARKVMSPGAKRAARTAYQLVVALVVAVPVIVAALPGDVQAAPVVVGFAVWVAAVSRIVNALEDAGLIPAWLKDSR